MRKLSPAKLEELLQALEKVPANFSLREIIANALVEQSCYEEAKVHFEVLLRAQPQDVELQESLANVFIQLGKYAPATIILEQLESSGQLTTFGEHLIDEIHDQNQGEEKDEVEDFEDEEYELNFGHFSDNQEEIDPEMEDFIAELEQPSTNFSHVGGMEDVKEEIRFKIIYPLTHPEISDAYGKKIGGGILLYGPPGCGKTHIARATAGEVEAHFINVGIHEILDMWTGKSEHNLHEIFELARTQTPCVLFFDEVEALGANRTDMKTSTARYLINQFLSEMDGIEIDNEGVLILAATNRPWYLDPAFRRPGRFDRIIFVPPPDAEARLTILKILLEKVNCVEDLELAKIIEESQHFSGADLEAVIDIAVERRMKLAMKAGQILPVESEDLLFGVQQIRPSTMAWFDTAKNYALYSNENGLYDDILKYLNMKK